MEFDADGRFVRELRAGEVTPAFTFMLENLSSGTTYYYTLETLGANGMAFTTQSGAFTTTGEAVGLVCAPSLQPEITGYYSITGIKLPKEPASGAYIITYDNGEAVKVVRIK